MTEADLTVCIREYGQAGLGGLHVIPIYGAQDAEDHYINYLTPEWMALFDHAVKEARKHGMDIDMTPGTGWPYGGPWVGPDDAAAKAIIQEYALSPGQPLEGRLQADDQPGAALQTVMAYGPEGEVRDVTHAVNEERRLQWSPDSGQWTVYAVFQGWTGQQVKRAAPGAEGNVLDYFSRESLLRYLGHFDQAFAESGSARPRAFYNDSYEVYGANWTDSLFDEFTARRGYDLRHHLPALLGQAGPEYNGRVRSDFCETISGVLLEDFTQTWVAWAHDKGAVTRNQAHGSPGNLLDLYAAADIPETEGFGRGGAEILMTKFASSAANLNGGALVSSESCTWLDEHFQVSLAEVKSAIDQLFVAGVNHVLFHGTTYSPPDLAWPGWIFYASTNVAPSNPFWRDLPAVTGYIARCQSFLQQGTADHDLLVYAPFYDVWHDEEGKGVPLIQFTVHHTDRWLHGGMPGLSRTAGMLYERGYTFDYVSDRLVTGDISVSDGAFQTKGGTYRAILVPPCTHMPVATMRRLSAFIEDGGRVLFVDQAPSRAPGFLNAAERTERLASFAAKCTPNRVVPFAQLQEALENAGIARETLRDAGLEFVRRRHGDGSHYFIVNRGEAAVDAWVRLAREAESVMLFDPRFEREGLAWVRRTGDNRMEVRLDLAPGESVVAWTSKESLTGASWPYLDPAGDAVEIHGPWHVEFLEGGPREPAPMDLAEAGFWTGRGNADADAFSGTARYQTAFPHTGAGDLRWILDLGEVRDSARVFVNGQEMPVLAWAPYRADVTVALKPGGNSLAVEVTNLAANRIADMDRRGVPWKKYFFVNIKYKEFDASDWPVMPSGLGGPVRLIPFKRTPSD